MRGSSKKKGFSLIEQIASIAIIMLVVVVGLSSMVAYTKGVALSGKRTTNVADAQKKLGNSLTNGATDTTVQKDTTSTALRMTLDLGVSLGGSTEIKGGTVTTYADPETDPTKKNKTSLKTYRP